MRSDGIALPAARIALVCPYSWSRPGGVQAHVAGLAEALRRRGAAVDVLAPADGPAPGVVALGRSLPVPDNGAVTRVALGPGAIRRTVRAVRDGGYELVHVHEPMLPVVGLAAVLAARVPVVGTFHMVAASPRWYRRFAPVVRRGLAALDGRIAVSEEARRFVEQVAPGDYAVVPNAIDTRPYAAAAPDRGGRRVVFVGRPDWRKGLPVLIEALSLMDGGTTLDLVGVTARELERSAPPSARRRMPRVRALGRLSEAGKAQALARADVVCIPSLRSESFGVVLVEAMAAGAPVVASDLPGYRAVLPAEAGRLIAPGDAAALAAALAELLADDALRLLMGEAGRRAAAAYDWDAVLGRVLEVYARVLVA